MKVSDLAKELNISNDRVLQKLKALKLKAKGKEQELNIAVASVVKSALLKDPGGDEKEQPSAKAEKSEKPAESVKSEVKPKVEDQPKKTTVKKATTKKVADKAVKTFKKKIVKKRTIIKKKKAAPESEETKTKPKISEQPFVTLKPLSKKRRKRGGRETEQDETVKSDDVKTEGGEDTTEAATGESGRVSSEAPARDVSQMPSLEINLPIMVKDLSVKLGEKPSAVLKKLMEMGIMATINQNLSEEIVRKVAAEFGYNISKIRSQEEQLVDLHSEEVDDPALLVQRAPVVTFMGHVDHGKTTLVDKIRRSKIADSEHGGITQHIGAYSVALSKGRITFLDTPGHEAFTAMRARGAHITDLVVIVVAADEGIKPQTEEAIDHARAAGCPIVVAVTKIDARNAALDKVKKQLADHGLASEDWGGKTVVVGVSGITGEGIDELLEMILLEAELLELKVNPGKKASGIVIEAHLSRGKGAVADMIVQAGTLREGDIIVAGPYYGRVKAMIDDRDRNIKEAGPSTPVEVLGLPGVPEAGDIFYAMEDEKLAKQVVAKRQEELKNQKLMASSKITLEDLYSQIQEVKIKELGVILKADVQGSLEALVDSLEKIPSEEVKIKFIHAGVGEVNLSDVLLARASNAIIMAFHVSVEGRAQEEVDKSPVDIRKYRIIYDAVNDMRNALEGMLEPTMKKNFVGRIEVREVFKLSKFGIVAGCFVQKGKVKRKNHADVVRNGEVVHSSAISSLKRFKDDVREVSEGMECGVTIDGFDKYQVGDIFEVYELERIVRKL